MHEQAALNFDVPGFLRSYGYRCVCRTNDGWIWCNGRQRLIIYPAGIYMRYPAHLDDLIRQVAGGLKQTAREVEAIALAPSEAREEETKPALLPAPQTQEEKRVKKMNPSPTVNHMNGRIKALHLQGMSPGQIAKRLRSEGLRTLRKKKPNRNQVQMMLTRWKKQPELMEAVKEVSAKQKTTRQTRDVREKANGATKDAPHILVAILQEPSLSEAKKRAMILAWCDHE